jgi:porin
MLWREPGTEEGAQGVGLFCRVGASPGDRSLLSFSGDAGVCYTGLLPGRNADECGLGVAWGRMGRHAREAVRDANFLGGSTAPLPDYEMALEVTYRAQVRPWWTIQPGLQYILHPGGSRATPDAVVVGLRTSIAF